MSTELTITTERIDDFPQLLSVIQPAERFNLEQTVLTHQDKWIIEHGFHRLKGVPLWLNSLYVENNDQVVGLTNLLSIAVRMLTLIEFVVRRKLTQNQEKLG
jgi:transposase